MKQRVSLKLLILFGITCTTFMLGQSRLHAADIIENKSSTFSTQLNNRTDSTSNDSAIAEKIRAQRAAIDARDNRNTATAQVKSSASQNNCDNDLRKCINNTCGANYKKCETDSDTTFSDKLNTCRKNTTCSAHEFTLFTNEIKEDKKQAISLALYNNVLDCGNSYNDCIIQQCGPKFNKCLSKSAGDKAINACKTIAQNCTEADSGLSGRVGNVFGIVRVDAEKQIKTDEQKLQTLRDQMRNSCRTLGALFDDRSLDCVFTANFFAGDDKTHPMASKKLYAGSLFDCTPDWFGIDITTFKENAYRATRAQSAASAAMLGSGVGTAVGALTSGAISRAIDTKKAKDALEDACKENGQVLKDGKCVDKEPDDTDEDSADEEYENEEESLTPYKKCTQSGGAYNNNNCTCPDDKKLNGDMCVDMKKKDKCEKAGGKLNVLGQCKCTDETKKYENEQCIDDPDAIAKKDCKDSGGKWKKNQCQCDDETQKLINGKCTKQTSSSNTTNTSGSNSSSWFVDPPQYTKSSSFKCNGITIQTSKANSASELKCVSTLTATSICSTYDKSTGHDVDCDTKTKTCAYSCNDILEKKYYLVCCNINNEDESVTCKGINKIGTYDALTGPKISVADCK